MTHKDLKEFIHTFTEEQLNQNVILAGNETEDMTVKSPSIIENDLFSNCDCP